MSLLFAHKLSFSYHDRRPVLAELDFQVASGQALGLAGANGSGKSTLINLLSGLFPPTSGELRLDDLSSRETFNKLKTASALLPQNVDHWLLGETGAEDLGLGLDWDKPDTRAHLDAIIERWELAEILDRPVEILSLGQKKRLAMAAALARRPEAVFLDEPFSGLDWPGTRTMLEDLKRLKASGVIVIMSTHEPGLVNELVDNWLLLKSGGGHLYGKDLAVHFEEYGVRPLQRIQFGA